MRDQLVPLVLATAATLFFPSGATAARTCDSTNGTFALRLGDLRYDGPDPSKNNGLSTIAAALHGATGPPLYECIGQWPEAWAGWYEGGSSPIWGDCIYTGAGLAPDETVSFAVDWKTKTFFVSHTFACSGQTGSVGLATGSISLDVNCTAVEGSTFCTPQATETGARPSISVPTKLLQVQANATSACANSPEKYQSWIVDNWLRHIEMKPGSSPTDPKLAADSGPSFTLRNMASGDLLNCTPGEKQNGTFVGNCESMDATGTTGEFVFDATLNMLEISQHWKCEDSTLDAVGVGYMQASCSRVFNGDEFTCVSLPLWVGTGVI